MKSTNGNGSAGRYAILVIVWSFGLYLLMNSYQYLGAIVAARISGQSFEAIISGKFSNHQTELAMALASLFIGIPLIFLTTRFLWRRCFAWIRLQVNLKCAFSGLLLGLALPFLIITAMNLLGIARIAWSPANLQSDQGIAFCISYACMALFTGIAEEVVFRGMAVREIAVRNGWIGAAIIGGVYFGVLHLIGKLSEITLMDASWIMLAGILVSFMFVAMYVRSQSLWLPIGFHIAWNFCLKGIMGVTMSGNESRVGLFDIELAGDPLLTGGTFGIESSVFSLVAYVLVAFVFVGYPWRGRIEFLGARQ
jgi:membrane protease YdiL (CAAX protease family)